jgi:hypothetical protein
MIDFADFDTKGAEEGAEMVVCYPDTRIPMTLNGEDPPTLFLLGHDSARYRRARREMLRKRQDASSRNGGIVPPELDDNITIDMMLGVLTGFKNVVLDGEPLAYSPANARKWFARCPFVVEQADKFVHERQNFMKVWPNGSSA